MLHQYSNLIQQVKEIVEKPVGEYGPIAKYLDIKELCLKSGVGREETLHVKEVLVHKANRGGLGVNAHNAHRHLSMIHSVGADLKLLENACAVEILPIGQDGAHNAVYHEQLSFNHTLVKNSKEMLAPVGGQERFFSLGTGHTAAGCRAANAQCKTPYTKMADPQGRINPTFLASSNANMAVMLNVGWKWFIVPQWFTQEIPTFPHLAQAALNASNNLRSCGNEIETMANMVEDLSVMPAVIDWSEVVNATAATEPTCKEYLHDVAKYVRVYGGPREQDYPYIDFLGTFANGFGVTLFIGQEFFQALTNIDSPKLCMTLRR